MIATDNNALRCDLAEVYHIYDYRSLPAEMVATFACGLRENSRIKMKLRGVTAPDNEILLAIVADRIGDVLYALCRGKGKRPPRIAENYFIKEKKKDESIKSFKDADAFDRAMEELNRLLEEQ